MLSFHFSVKFSFIQNILNYSLPIHVCICILYYIYMLHVCMCVYIYIYVIGFPGGLVEKNLPATARDTG